MKLSSLTSIQNDLITNYVGSARVGVRVDEGHLRSVLAIHGPLYGTYLDHPGSIIDPLRLKFLEESRFDTKGGT